MDSSEDDALNISAARRKRRQTRQHRNEPGVELKSLKSGMVNYALEDDSPNSPAWSNNSPHIEDTHKSANDVDSCSPHGIGVEDATDNISDELVEPPSPEQTNQSIVIGADATNTSIDSNGKKIQEGETILVKEELDFIDKAAMKSHKTEKRKKRKRRSSQKEEASSTATTISAALNELVDVEDRKEPSQKLKPLSNHSTRGSALSLVSDGKVYVQRGRSFRATSRDKVISRPSSRQEVSSRQGTTTALSMAVGLQRKFMPLATMCHGLLAGVAIWQCITVFQQNSDGDQLSLIENYSKVARIFQSMFYLLAAVAVVSVLDRCVPTSFSWQSIRDLVMYRPCPMLALLAGCGALLTSTIAGLPDDRLALHVFNETLWADVQESEPLISEWLVLNLIRCLLAALSFLIVSIISGCDGAADTDPQIVSTLKGIIPLGP